jgi:hypothetical protein
VPCSRADDGHRLRQALRRNTGNPRLSLGSAIDGNPVRFYHASSESRASPGLG